MKVVVQNLQKTPGLASLLMEEFSPDILLAQEINWETEKILLNPYSVAHNTSKRGYGTAIITNKKLSNIEMVQAPHAEVGGFITKKTTVATYDSTPSIQVVSFHGYNGQPFKDPNKLVDHVQVVLAALDTKGPAMFAGDFNTWSQVHVEKVDKELRKYGFQKAYSWPYPGREIPLDHVFLRGIRLVKASHFRNQSDHCGAILEIQVPEGPAGQ